MLYPVCNVLAISFRKQKSELVTNNKNIFKLTQSTLGGVQDEIKPIKPASETPTHRDKMRLIVDAVENCHRADRRVSGINRNASIIARDSYGNV